jgi:NAD(P)-dependent dehydrogenase (short-subunit alcohol dehydrogenase family)
MGSIEDAFAGKSVLVTGAASGIGEQIAIQTAAAGATVHASDVVDFDAQAGVAKAVKLDVSDRAQMQAAIDDLVEAHGCIDYIFNNAGVAIFGEFENVTLDDWDKIIDVNLKGVAYGSKIAYDQMVKQGSGHIISTASVAGLIPVPLQAHYVATKHAIVGMHKTLELEAPSKGVRTTVFCPAFIDTGMIENNTFRGSLEGADGRKLMPIPPLPADKAVQRLLKGVAGGKTIVITPFYGRAGWWLERVNLPLSQQLHRFTLKETRKRAKKSRRS